MSNELVKVEQVPSVYGDTSSFEHAQRVAKMLAQSNLIPTTYQGKVENCMIALEMSNRCGASPLMVMQNLHIIQGKPSWSSPFVIASINSCGKFSTQLRFRSSGEGDEYGYEAFATDKDGNETVAPKITWKMVKDEGWLTKAGSKWKTMPELMFRYRAAAFFGRLYTPEILMGMQTTEEMQDVVTPVIKIDKEAQRVELLLQDATTPEEVEALRPHVQDGQMELFENKLKEVSNAN